MAGKMNNGTKINSLGFNRYIYFKTRTSDIKHLKEYLKLIKQKLAYPCENKYQMGVSNLPKCLAKYYAYILYCYVFQDKTLVGET